MHPPSLNNLYGKTAVSMRYIFPRRAVHQNIQLYSSLLTDNDVYDILHA